MFWALLPPDLFLILESLGCSLRCCLTSVSSEDRKTYFLLWFALLQTFRRHLMISCAAARLGATNTPLSPGGNVEMAAIRLSAVSNHLSPARRITLISRR